MQHLQPKRKVNTFLSYDASKVESSCGQSRFTLYLSAIAHRAKGVDFHSESAVCMPCQHDFRSRLRALYVWLRPTPRPGFFLQALFCKCVITYAVLQASAPGLVFILWDDLDNIRLCCKQLTNSQTVAMPILVHKEHSESAHHERSIVIFSLLFYFWASKFICAAADS